MLNETELSVALKCAFPTQMVNGVMAVVQIPEYGAVVGCWGLSSMVAQPVPEKLVGTPGQRAGPIAMGSP